MKKVLTLIVGGMLLGQGLEHWYETGVEPVHYASASETEQLEEEPRRVLIKIDYTGWTQERIVEEILASGLPMIMVDVARCESTLRQYHEDGSVVRGIVDPRDTGLFQINTYYHLEAAEAMGLDIEDTPDNIAYAKHLYETQGLQPWSASKHCWSK